MMGVVVNELTNVVKLFCNMVSDSEKSIQELHEGSNRINNVGDGLELYIRESSLWKVIL